MNAKWAKRAATACGALVLIALESTWAQRQRGSSDSNSAGGAYIADSEFTAEQLQSVLRNHVNNYTTEISRVCSDVSRDIESRGVRARVQRWKLDSISSAIHIAMGPNPYINLLDFLVLITLELDTVSRHWNAVEFDGHGGPIIEELGEHEERIWTLFRRVFKDTDLEPKLKELIALWWEANPNSWSVSTISFEEFAADRGIDPVLSARSARGMLGSLKRSAIAIDQARALAERQAFIVQAMPALVSEHARTLILEASASEDAEYLRQTRDAIMSTSERLLEELGATRELVEDIRSQMLEEVDRMLTEQREVSIREITESVQLERAATIADLRSLSTSEREATIEAIAELLSAEREASIREVSNAIALEREAAIADIHGILDRVLGVGPGETIDSVFDRLTRLTLLAIGVLFTGAVLLVLLLKLVRNRSTS